MTWTGPEGNPAAPGAPAAPVRPTGPTGPARCPWMACWMPMYVMPAAMTATARVSQALKSILRI